MKCRTESRISFKRNWIFHPISKLPLLIIAGALAWPGLACGTINGGTATKISPPSIVGKDNFNVSTIFAFDERQSVLLPGSLSVDIPANGAITANTMVNSHYVFFDPLNTETLTATVTFDGDILGIMTSLTTLVPSDFLGAPQTTYLSPTARGFEPMDSATILGPRTISVTLNTNSPGDYLRVVTVVPEPASLSLLALTSVGLLARRRGR